jgi:hypothetical protein
LPPCWSSPRRKLQPIGAAPEGGTLLILRLNNGKFIDSADAMCGRIGRAEYGNPLPEKS